MLGDWRTGESGRRLYRVAEKVDVVGERGLHWGGRKGRVGVLPSLRDGHAAGQAAAPPPPAPRHALAWCRGTWEGARLADFEIRESERHGLLTVTGKPGRAAAVCTGMRKKSMLVRRGSYTGEEERGEKGVLPSLRDGHAAGQAATPPPPAPRHALAWCRGTWDGARLVGFEIR